MNNTQYSVLMSVYYKENAAFLEKAIDSIWNQTIPPDDFVLICDGPLNESLNSVIHKMERSHSGILHVIRLNTNGGLGNALNTGLKYCKNDLVARMDSDDISRHDRCEKQLKVFHEHPEINLCSGTIEEFSSTPDHIESIRVLPETHKEILSFAKRRCPFNHPCVMYRKSAVEAVGGYQSIYLLEDYSLWIRMLTNGYIGYNIPQPLLWMRGGSQMYKRRSGWRFTQSHITLYQYMKKNHFISPAKYYFNCFLRIIALLLPNCFRQLAYLLFLRKRSRSAI